MPDHEIRFQTDKIKIFISYSRKEAVAVERLHQELSKDEDLEVLRDLYDIAPGE